MLRDDEILPTGKIEFVTEPRLASLRKSRTAAVRSKLPSILPDGTYQSLDFP